MYHASDIMHVQRCDELSEARDGRGGREIGAQTT